MTARPIRVLVVDDSALMRRMLTMALSQDPGIQVVDAVESALAARDAIKRLKPDVLTLDIEMPGMDGVTFLGKLMRARPMPVIILSTLMRQSSELGLKLLEVGAYDFVAKPDTTAGVTLDGFAQDLARRIRAAARSSKRVQADGAPARAKPPAAQMTGRPAPELVVVGSSTGGIPAVQTFLTGLVGTGAAIAIAQHMPANFTARFATRLRAETGLDVTEAADGKPILPGQAVIAPGGAHLRVERTGQRPVCRIDAVTAPGEQSPSVDVLFHSAAEAFGPKTTAAILTGMGADGADGMAALHRRGAVTFAQDEASSVVFGMPRAAIERGAVDASGTPAWIAESIAGSFAGRAMAAAV